MSELGHNKNSFSKAIGLKNNVTIGRIVNEDREPSYDILRRIIETFGHRFNIYWLLVGQGEIELDLVLTDDPQGSYRKLEDKEVQKIVANLESLSESIELELRKLRERMADSAE